MNGASHWVRYFESQEMVILLFDMCDEEFQVMRLLGVLASTTQPYYFSLVVSDGLLSLIQCDPGRNRQKYDPYDGCCIWLMKEYGVILLNNILLEMVWGDAQF
jgi:hypothetical protein